MQSAATKLALLPDEPAGWIPTRTPGAVRFEANLTWQSPEEAVQGEICPSLPQTVKASINESNDSQGVRHVSGELRSFSEEDLERVLDSVLSNLTSKAAISEAVLEMHSFRVARPLIVSREALERLARSTWEAGFRVRFGPCWTPLCNGTEAAVGIRGAENAHERLRDLGSWVIASPDL